MIAKCVMEADVEASEEQLDCLCEKIPDHAASPKGGRSPTGKREAIAGIFWILDNGAKWKDLPRRFGTKSAVHRWFARWAHGGVFERLMAEAGSLVEQRGGYRLYKCFVDGTYSTAKGGGDGIGCTKAGKGVKIMIMVDAHGASYGRMQHFCQSSREWSGAAPV